jgi:anion transporter
MMSADNEKGVIDSLREKYGIPLAIMAMLILWYMPAPEGLPPAGQKALAMFAGIFILYLTEAIPLVATSLAVAPLAVLMGIAKVGAALAPFASSSVFLMLGAFILAAAMIKTKLAERITYIILHLLGSSTRRITVGIMAANIILAFLIPSSTARTAVLLPVCVSIIALFAGTGRTKFAANLLLTLAFTNATISAGILTATVPNPVTVEFIQKAGGAAISYAEWLKIGFPPALLMTLLTWLLIQYLFPPEEKQIPGGDQYVAARLKAMGPMNGKEKFSLLIFTLVVVLWATGTVTKIDTTTACLAAAIPLFFPKVGVMNWNDANPHIGYNVLLITGGGLSMGGILMNTGATKWLAATVFAAFGLHGMTILVLLLVVMFIVQFMHLFFAGTTVMATAFLPLVIALGMEAGLPPAVLALPAGMIIGGYPLLMFYCTSPNIMVYGTERLALSDFPKVGVPVSILACIVYAICAATYWRWLGLF